jgi:uncharacterized protein
VPRWGGRPGADYYPWLVAELAAKRPPVFAEVMVCDLPDPSEPRQDTWPPAIRAALGADREVLARTFVLGHSVGCQAALHALAALPTGVTIAGMLAVAGWWTVDRPWPTIRPWQDNLASFDHVRAAVAKISLVISDDDPFTADHAANAALWRARLAAEVTLVPGGRHFNNLQEPAVLAALLRLTA